MTNWPTRVHRIEELMRAIDYKAGLALTMAGRAYERNLALANIAEGLPGNPAVNLHLLTDLKVEAAIARLQGITQLVDRAEALSADDLLHRARHWIWLAAPHQEADGQAVAVIDLRAIEEALGIPEADQRWKQLAGL